jgi:hypothetical protein
LPPFPPFSFPFNLPPFLPFSFLSTSHPPYLFASLLTSRTSYFFSSLDLPSHPQGRGPVGPPFLGRLYCSLKSS